MPAKVTIYDIDLSKLPTKSVEIPETCPDCGADLTKPGAIVEGAWLWTTSQGGRIEGGSVEADGFDHHETRLVERHICNACEAVLAGFGVVGPQG